MAHASQDEHEPTFKFIEEVHNCPAAWNVSSVVYKDTKNKQTNKQNGAVRDKLGFVHCSLSISPPLSVSSLSILLLFHFHTRVPLH